MKSFRLKIENRFEFLMISKIISKKIVFKQGMAVVHMHVMNQSEIILERQMLSIDYEIWAINWAKFEENDSIFFDLSDFIGCPNHNNLEHGF